MKKPSRKDFKTSTEFLKAVERFWLAQYDAHIISWYWDQRLKSKDQGENHAKMD